MLSQQVRRARRVTHTAIRVALRLSAQRGLRLDYIRSEIAVRQSPPRRSKPQRKIAVQRVRDHLNLIDPPSDGEMDESLDG